MTAFCILAIWIKLEPTLDELLLSDTSFLWLKSGYFCRQQRAHQPVTWRDSVVETPEWPLKCTAEVQSVVKSLLVNINVTALKTAELDLEFFHPLLNCKTKCSLFLIKNLKKLEVFNVGFPSICLLTSSHKLLSWAFNFDLKLKGHRTNNYTPTVMFCV